jgi:hypothetical protein
MKVYSTTTVIKKRRRRIGECPLHLKDAFKKSRKDVWGAIARDIAALNLNKTAE